MIERRGQFLLLLFAFWCCGTLFAGTQGRFLLMEWNVENLYDTCHNVGVDDQDFLPDGTYKWGQRRYLHKLSQIARTIASAGGVSPVDLVALCEVENDSVLVQLMQRSVLGRLGYKYVMTHSADRRGMNVALLYQPGRFKPVAVQIIRIPHMNSERPTRDILHVEGVVPTSDTLDVYVCHLPSRSGGQYLTDSYRLRGAMLMRMNIDSVFNIRKRPLIVITGDFNDEPQNNSFRKGLQVRSLSQSENYEKRILYILSDNLYTYKGIRGTYFYQGTWNRLDHVVVNGGLLNENGPFRLERRGCKILDFPWLLKNDSKGREVPQRTFLGTFYQGGISDHLPLLTYFEF